jgi:hypothetical protein
VADADRAVHAPAVAEPVRRQAHDLDVPVVAGPVEPGVQRDFRQDRIVVIELLDDKGDGRAVPAEEGEVQAVVGRRDAEREGPAAGRADDRRRG